MNNDNKLTSDLLDFIHLGATPFHVTQTIAYTLEKAGYTALSLTSKWDLKKGGKYFVTRNGSAILAFAIGTGEAEEHGFRVIATHGDSPTFRIKPSPVIGCENYYLKINTEVYGGPVLMTWLDRPLSIAGRVSLKGKNPLWPINRLINFNRPLLTIPSLAIHLNRSVNEGMELKRQTHMLPLLGILPGNGSPASIFNRMIANELDISENDILDFDLTINEWSKGCTFGLNNEFISSARIDNLAMVHAGLISLLESQDSEATRMLCVFDNEEVGSLTKQGAGSPFFTHLFKRVLENLGKSGEQVYRSIYNSFMISADMAHGVHPSYPEKHDPVNHPLLNKGPVIKIAANQKYTSDSDSIAVFEALCQQANVPYQKFVNHSDIIGGSTLGNVLTGQVDFRCVDVGNPMLAMHSARELAGTIDHDYITRAFATFYSV